LIPREIRAILAIEQNKNAASTDKIFNEKAKAGC
jgi:hypothetical protein